MRHTPSPARHRTGSPVAGVLRQTGRHRKVSGSDGAGPIMGGSAGAFRNKFCGLDHGTDGLRPEDESNELDWGVRRPQRAIPLNSVLTGNRILNVGGAHHDGGGSIGIENTQIPVSLANGDESAHDDFGGGPLGQGDLL